MSSASNNENNKDRLPIVIAGAGPCGLVAALTLQQQKVPFVIYERASRDKLCSNVGAGFDLAPTTIDILENRLKISNLAHVFHTYAGMYMCDQDCKPLRVARMSDIDVEYQAMAANRAVMQKCFMNRLFQDMPDEKEQSEILKCGIQVTRYTQDDDQPYVDVQLSDGTSVRGSALLACDGIHSAVRKTMVGDKQKDELQYQNIACWWGRIDRVPGSDLDKALEATQTYKKEGVSFLWAMGDKKRPGTFMAGPTGDSFIWAFFMKSKTPGKKSDDLTRRGGMVLNEETKQELMDMVNDRGDLIRLAIQQTAPGDITKVGLFDRKNLNLPYARGRVALLGDSAHPQSPFMGQGVNQAITDAYVCSMRLAATTSTDQVPQALQAYDSKKRRKGVNGVIKAARSYGNFSVSENIFMSGLFKFFATKCPLSWLWKDMLAGDQPNKDFVEQLDKDLGKCGI